MVMDFTLILIYTEIVRIFLHTKMSDPWSRRQIEIVSGLSAGFATTIITHPLDLIKVRLQLSTSPSSRPFDSLRNVISGIVQDARAARSAAILKRPQIYYLFQQCYRGVGPNLVGNVSAWGLYFALYSEFKQFMPTADGTTKYFTASTLAGISTSVLTNPIWVVKTRMLSTSNRATNSYKSALDGIRLIYHKEGIATFWRGTLPSLFSVFQASLQFTFYDHAKNYLMEKLNSTSLSTLQYIYASVASKTLSMAIWYPTQVVRSRLQSYNFDGERRSLVLVIAQIYKNERGWRGFYRGLGANIVRVLPSTIITFVSYETTKSYLSEA